MPQNKNRKFGFLVHPRGREDFLLRFPLLRILPSVCIDFLTSRFPPVLVSRVTGLRDKEGNPIDGYIIAITMTARQMTSDRKGAVRQIRKAVKYAEKIGVGVMGFGAMTASFTQGGKLLLDDVENLGITTGRAYTAKTVTDYAKKVITDFSIPIDKLELSVVGAAGSIGSSCAKLLAKYGITHINLIDLERKNHILDRLVTRLQGLNPNVVVNISHKIKDIKSSDLIIAATSSPEVVIEPEDLAPGAVVLNDAQPSDISPEVVKQRDDVLVIEAGVITTPGIKCNFNLGLAARDETFCCLGEALILAHDGHFKHYALGELDLELIEDISTRGAMLGFTIAPYQYQGKYVEAMRIEHVMRVISEKYGN